MFLVCSVSVLRTRIEEGMRWIGFMVEDVLATLQRCPLFEVLLCSHFGDLGRMHFALSQSIQAGFSQGGSGVELCYQQADGDVRPGFLPRYAAFVLAVGWRRSAGPWIERLRWRLATTGQPLGPLECSMGALPCPVVRADVCNDGEPRSRKRAAVQTKMKERKGGNGVVQSDQKGRDPLLGPRTELAATRSGLTPTPPRQVAGYPTQHLTV